MTDTVNIITNEQVLDRDALTKWEVAENDHGTWSTLSVSALSARFVAFTDGEDGATIADLTGYGVKPGTLDIHYYEHEGHSHFTIRANVIQGRTVQFTLTGVTLQDLLAAIRREEYRQSSS